MNLYSQDEERAIRMQRLVDDWFASGLLIREQRDRVMPELAVTLRRTNRFLRITLFVFGYLIVNALTGLAVVTLNLGEDPTMILALVAGAAFFAIAQWLAKRQRLYHFGIEEASAVASVTFFAIGTSMLLHPTFSVLQAMVAAAAGSFIVFRRFGYVYAGVAAILFAALAPFGLQQADTTRRLFAMVILLTAFFFARERRQDHDWDYPGDSYAVLEAVAWGALYFLINLQVSSWLASPDGYRQFYWATYVATWVLPVAGLVLAIRDRHRIMLDLNIVLAIVTLMSNKPYLGAEQNTWDPIGFGLLLIVIAIGLKRWLASGPNGSRHGFVAHRLLASEKARLALAGSATVFAPGVSQSHTHTPQAEPIGGGGRSGGAGATGTF